MMILACPGKHGRASRPNPEAEVLFLGPTGPDPTRRTRKARKSPVARDKKDPEEGIFGQLLWVRGLQLAEGKAKTQSLALGSMLQELVCLLGLLTWSTPFASWKGVQCPMQILCNLPAPRHLAPSLPKRHWVWSP